MEKDLPAGFHFVPTDQELITHYLNLKKPGEALSSSCPVIERDVYASEPWNIFNIQGDPWEIVNTYEKSDKKSTEYVIHVITPLKMVSTNRVSRTAGCGTWKGQTTGKKIKNRNNEVIGFKKMLVFETKNKGKESGENNTHWIMHEYSLKEIVGADDYVLCKIKRVELKKSEKKRRFEAISGDHRDGINDTRGETIGEAQKLLRSQEEDNGNHKSFDAMDATPLTMIHVPDIPPLPDEDELDPGDSDFDLGEFDLDFGSPNLDFGLGDIGLDFGLADLDFCLGDIDLVDDCWQRQEANENIGEAQKLLRSQEEDNGNHMSFDATDATSLTMIHVQDIPPLLVEDKLDLGDIDFDLGEFDLDFGSPNLDFGLGDIDLEFGSADLDFCLGDIDLVDDYWQRQEANESQPSPFNQPKST